MNAAIFYGIAPASVKEQRPWGSYLPAPAASPHRSPAGNCPGRFPCVIPTGKLTLVS